MKIHNNKRYKSIERFLQMCFVLSHLSAFHYTRSQASFLNYIKMTSYLFLCNEKYLSVPLHHNTEKSIVSLAAVFWMSCNVPPKELLGKHRVTSKKLLRGRLRKVWCSFNLFPVCFKQILLKLHTVKPYIMDARLTWTPRYYGQFFLPLGNESPYIFSNFNLLIHSLSMASSVPVLTGFNCLHCIFFLFSIVLL